MGKIIIITVLMVFAIGFLTSCGTQNEKVKTGIPEPESYISCGCGCCGGVEPLEECLYRSKGDDINTIMEQDRRAAQNPDCAVQGCSIGIKYRYCD